MEGAATASFLSELADQIPEAFSLITYAYVLLLLSWPLLLWMERRWPPVRRTPASSYAFNAKVMLFNLAVTPLFWGLAVALSSSVGRAIGLPVLPYPTLSASLGIPFVDTALHAVVLFFVAAFLGDLWYYWWHRMQHELPALWEIHKLHHSDEDLNATSIYRSHFFELGGQALVRGFSVGLIVDLGGAPQTGLAIAFAGILPPVWDTFIHANVRLDRLRLLPVLSTPQFHWIHHSRLPQHQDKNYAIWLPLFDVLFGSYYRPAKGEYPPTGLSSGEKIDSVWRGQIDPLRAWARMLSGRPPHPTADAARLRGPNTST